MFFPPHPIPYPPQRSVDLQSGEHLESEEVRLVDSYGPYEKGLDDKGDGLDE